MQAQALLDTEQEEKVLIVTRQINHFQEHPNVQSEAHMHPDISGCMRSSRLLGTMLANSPCKEPAPKHSYIMRCKQQTAQHSTAVLCHASLQAMHY